MEKLNAVTVLTAVLGCGLMDTAGAANVDAIAYRQEVQSCVAEIKDSIDVNDASRVRHDIEIVKEKLVGFAMKINTSLYTEYAGEPTREYATYCVVNGAHKPLKFEINEIDSGV